MAPLLALPHAGFGRSSWSPGVTVSKALPTGYTCIMLSLAFEWGDSGLPKAPGLRTDMDLTFLALLAADWFSAISSKLNLLNSLGGQTQSESFARP